MTTFRPRHGGALHKALNDTHLMTGTQKLEAEREMARLECDRKQAAVDRLQMLSDAERTSLRLSVEILRLRTIEAVERGEFSYFQNSRW